MLALRGALKGNVCINFPCLIYFVQSGSYSVIANSALECFTISRGQHHPTGVYICVKTCSVNKASVSFVDAYLLCALHSTTLQYVVIL